MHKPKLYTIYKITNKIDGRCYVGFDSLWPRRKRAHIQEAHNKNQFQYWFDLHKALRQFGVDNFRWEILYQSPNAEHTLTIMEPYFIQIHNAYRGWINGGYNMTLGGDCGVLGLKQSEEHKQKRIAAMMKTKANTAKPLITAHKTIPKIYQPKPKRRGWILIPPAGDLIITDNLTKYSRQFSLHHGAMADVADGKFKQHHGWGCKRCII